MSMEIAKTTLAMAIQLPARQQAARNEALETQVALIKKANATPEAAAQLVQATLENLGNLIDTYA